MLILATIAINVAAIAIWSFAYGANGFKEVGKLVRGEAAFIPPTTSTDESTGTEKGPEKDDDRKDPDNKDSDRKGLSRTRALEYEA